LNKVIHKPFVGLKGREGFVFGLWDLFSRFCLTNGAIPEKIKHGAVLQLRIDIVFNVSAKPSAVTPIEPGKSYQHGI
jgi:hypothetical protein